MGLTEVIYSWRISASMPYTTQSFPLQKVKITEEQGTQAKKASRKAYRGKTKPKLEEITHPKRRKNTRLGSNVIGWGFALLLTLPPLYGLDAIHVAAYICFNVGSNFSFEWGFKPGDLIQLWPFKHLLKGLLSLPAQVSDIRQNNKAPVPRGLQCLKNFEHWRATNQNNALDSGP